MENTEVTYLIRSVSGAPSWETVPRLAIDRVLWTPDCGIRAAGQLCHDTEVLYVHLQAAEREIRAEYTAPLSRVCEDSCLEFFFMPENETRYFNFEINPNGCLWIGFGHGREDSTVLVPKNIPALFGIRTARTREGWEVFYRIPCSFLRLFWPDFTFSGVLRANLYKCGEKTPEEHYLSWSPVSSETPDFHRPVDFGKMVFEQSSLQHGR